MSAQKTQLPSVVVALDIWGSAKKGTTIAEIKKQVHIRELPIQGGMLKLALEPKVNGMAVKDITQIRETLVVACEKSGPKMKSKLEHKDGLLINKNTWGKIMSTHDQTEKMFGNVRPQPVHYRPELLYAKVGNKTKESLLRYIESMESPRDHMSSMLTSQAQDGTRSVSHTQSGLYKQYKHTSKVGSMQNARVTETSPIPSGTNTYGRNPNNEVVNIPISNTKAKQTSATKTSSFQKKRDVIVRNGLDWPAFIKSIQRNRFEEQYNVKLDYDGKSTIYVMPGKFDSQSFIDQAHTALTEKYDIFRKKTGQF